jgi:leucyl aminopeptidase
MKEIINVELKTRKAEPDKIETDLLAVGIFSDAKELDKLNAQLDGRLDGAIERLIKLGDFKAKEGTSEVIYGNGRIGAKRILLVGLGEKKKATLDTVRKAAANAAKKSVELKIENLALALHKAFAVQSDLSAMGRAMAEGAYFGSYRYDEFVTESENGRRGRLECELVDSDMAKLKKLHDGVAKGVIIGKAQSYARTVANRPGNVISPAKLAELAKALVGGSKNLTCEIFDENRLAKEGMGGILAVGSGSQNKPRFIVLKYNAASKAAKSQPRVALVGKAITFDSGGISIKPAMDMEEMKLDKSGGIAVMVTLKAVADMGLPVNVVGLIPSAENLPSGTSYRPGDIVTTFSGKTVEVINTDAEGRMILCDALDYAVKEKCDIIIDIATLTGACRVALGKYMAGLMGNDQMLIKQLQRAAEDSGEKVWPMPSSDEYAQEMKSKIADLKNTGSKFGGACTAAAFLRQFVGNAKWAHLDIAGVDMIDKATEFAVEGASGFGVRLLTAYLMNLADQKR